MKKSFAAYFCQLLILFFALVLFSCVSTAGEMADYAVRDTSTGKTLFVFEPNEPNKRMVNPPARIKKLQSEDTENFIRELANYIVENSDNDFEIVKNIHDWIALNIRYDAESFWSGNIPSQNYAGVLTSGLAVCAGYAELFKIFCDEIGIESLIVSGYARGVSTSISGIFAKEDVNDSNHAWNVVKIGNNSYLVDCTWDAGYLSGAKAIQDYRTNYLFVNPEIMIYDHFPENADYQLLDRKITEDEFADFPACGSSFFSYINEVRPKLKKITEVEGKLELNFSAKENTYFLYQILDEYGSEIIENGQIFKLGNVHKKSFIFEKAGKYIVRVFASRQQYGAHEGIIDYGIISTKDFVPTEKERQHDQIADWINRGNPFNTGK